MRTIEEVQNEIADIIFFDDENYPWVKADQILSIVIGVKEEKCKGYMVDHSPNSSSYPCKLCQGTGTIKHPITIRDAIKGAQ